MRDPEPVARLAAVPGQLFQPGDLALAFDPRRVTLRQRRDQAADAVADLQREVRRDGAGEGADVLRGQLLRASQQLGVLRLAHGSRILASSARSFTSACWSTEIAS